MARNTWREPIRPGHPLWNPNWVVTIGPLIFGAKQLQVLPAAFDRYNIPVSIGLTPCSPAQAKWGKIQS
jgi:hypothetical protein